MAPSPPSAREIVPGSKPMRALHLKGAEHRRSDDLRCADREADHLHEADGSLVAVEYGASQDGLRLQHRGDFSPCLAEEREWHSFDRCRCEEPHFPTRRDGRTRPPPPGGELRT